MRGNSDPFSVSTIEVTPRVAQVLAFIRTHVLPSTFQPNAITSRLTRGDSVQPLDWSSPDLASLSWDVSIQDLQTEGNGLAVVLVASHLEDMAMLQPNSSTRNELSRLSLLLTTKSIALLRDSLTKDIRQLSSTDALNLIRNVYFLYRRSVIMGDHRSLEILSSLLQEVMFMGLGLKICDGAGWFLAAVDDILVYMCRTSKRPLFDYRWLPSLCSELWSTDELDLATPWSAALASLHVTIKDPQLRAAYIDARQMKVYTDDPLACLIWSDKPERIMILYMWIASKSRWLLLTTMELYFDMMEDYQEGAAPQRFVQQQTQAALALGLVYSIRNTEHNKTSSEQDIRDYSVEIMGHIMDLMKPMLEDTTLAPYVEQYIEAYLWLSFLGASYERRRSRTNPDGWFHQMLARLSIQIGIDSWFGLRCISDSFLFLEWEEHGFASWFEDTVLLGPKRSALPAVKICGTHREQLC